MTGEAEAEADVARRTTESAVNDLMLQEGNG